MLAGWPAKPLRAAQECLTPADARRAPFSTPLQQQRAESGLVPGRCLARSQLCGGPAYPSNTSSPPSASVASPSSAVVKTDSGLMRPSIFTFFFFFFWMDHEREREMVERERERERVSE